MCGIAGIITTQSDIDVANHVTRSIASLRHRGPDGDGLLVRRYSDGAAGLAHTRLSILDLSSAGAQPMQSSDQRHWITYNGEVYNFQDLRRDLSRELSHFRSESDTEVVLEALAAWGVEALARLRGMFGLGVWNESTKTLTLARDQFGIKPIYYASTGTTFVFASELRTILGTGLVPRALSSRGLNSYLRTGSVEAPDTIIEGVYSLRPGQYLQVALRGGLKVHEPAFYKHTPSRKQAYEFTSRAQALETLRDTLVDSVRRHRVSDVPLGVFLSGGIDSSALVALLKRAQADRPKTFSVVFAEQQFSERTHARVVSEHFGTDHQEILLTEQGMLSQLPDALSALDQPTSDGVNTYVISKAVREAGVTVALSGLGGDELFAGYPSFRRSELLAKFRVVPRFLRQGASGVGRTFLNGTVQRTKLWDMLGSDASPAEAYAVSRRMFSREETRRLGCAVEQVPVDHPDSDFGDTINAVSRLELQGYMANTLLRDADVMSMAHALEIRVPFVDCEVVDLVLGMPGRWKVSPDRPKALLLDALEGMLPESIWNRPKMGFSLPFERWMRSALQPEMEHTFREDGTWKSVGISALAALNTWRRFATTPEREQWSRPWLLYVLHKWCERNGVHL